MSTPIVIAKKTTDTTQDIVLHSQFANRHGLIAGATGTGKTVTLKVLAESFSRLGVPVFLADAKGDVSSLAKAGVSSPKFDERLKTLNIESVPFAASPVMFWDLFGQQGHPIRTTISEIGPLLLAQMLNLNDTQEGVLSAVFRIADDQGLLLIDFKDLKAMQRYWFILNHLNRWWKLPMLLGVPRNKYQKINLVYSVRTASELAYVDRIQEIAKLFGEGHSGFRFIPIITRDPDAALHDRLPVLIANGDQEKAAGSE